MALSNWATLVWNENGEPCEGKIEVEGISIAIYKNWIYVSDEKAWKEGSMFNKPTIMEISEGQIEYHRFKIIVSIGRNNDVFVLAEYIGDHGDQKETKQLIGIGAYGYDDDGNYIGVTEETKGEFFYWIKTSKEDWFPMSIDVTKIKDFKTFNQGDKYIADNLGFETPVNTDEPILSKVLKNIGQ